MPVQASNISASAQETSKPSKDWKTWAKYFCNRCKREFYREIISIHAICRNCDSKLLLLGTYDETPQFNTESWTTEELSHVRTLPNGKSVAVTNKGNIIDNPDFKQKLARDPHLMERTSKKWRNNLPRRADWKDL